MITEPTNVTCLMEVEFELITYLVACVTETLNRNDFGFEYEISPRHSSTPFLHLIVHGSSYIKAPSILKSSLIFYLLQ